MVLALLSLPLPAAAYPLPLAAGPRLDKKVVSMKESRTTRIVVQQKDYTCGAAAIATLLTYQFGRKTSEEDVRAAIAKSECRIPPKPATKTINTPRYDKIVATTMDDWLVCISSLSMIGSPVSPIVTSP